MIDFRPVFFIVGILLATLAVAMGIPALADAAVGHPDWQVFALSAALTLFVGGALAALLMGQVPIAATLIGIAGGMTVGIAEEMSTLFFSPAYKSAVAFALMVIILIVRPTGLFGGRSR